MSALSPIADKRGIVRFVLPITDIRCFLSGLEPSGSRINNVSWALIAAAVGLSARTETNTLFIRSLPERSPSSPPPDLIAGALLVTIGRGSDTGKIRVNVL